MVVWWLCWHRTILMRNTKQKQYSQFPPVLDFGKPWWGVAYVSCMTNLSALYAWEIRWHVTGMLSLAQHWHGRRALSNHVCAPHSYPCDLWFVCSTLRELAVSNLGQLLFCLSITWSRYRNAYRDLWIMSIVICLLVAILFRVYMLTTLMLKPVSRWRHQMKTFATLLALCAGNSPSTVNSPHKSQWCRALMFALICAWTNGSINNQDTGDLRHHHIHYDITVMCFRTTNSIPWLLMP